MNCVSSTSAEPHSLLAGSVDSLRGLAQSYRERIVRARRLVGTGGLEPPTSCMSSRRSNQLSYAPRNGDYSRSNLSNLLAFDLLAFERCFDCLVQHGVAHGRNFVEFDVGLFDDDVGREALFVDGF